MRHELDVFRNDWLHHPFRGLDRFFDDGRAWNWAPSFKPEAEVQELENAFLVTLDVPGVSKEDIHIEVTDGKLVIKGERKTDNTSKKGSVHFTERAFGKFERIFELGSEVTSENVEAHYKEGVLKISIPKAEKAKSKLIPILD